MSLTIEPTQDICCYDRKIQRVIYRSENENGPKEYTGNLEVVPRKGLDKHFRNGTLMNENVFVCGPSGCGKTTIVREYATNYHRINPTNKIYLITQSKEDNLPDFCRVWTAKMPSGITYEKFLNIQYLDFDYFKGNERIDVTADFLNALLIFDDFLYFEGENKKETELIRQRVCSTILQILNLGRKISCSAIITNHLLYDNHLNSMFQNLYSEINKFMFSTKSNKRQLSYVLKTYIGFSNEEIKQIMNFDSRSHMITISKDPNFILSSNRILLKQ
jgi:energy-coupling factor transporter ATP-binding protein EcfA2